MDVFGPFVHDHGPLALHLYANLFNDVWIGERGDVAYVDAVGNGGEHAAHDLAGAGLGHVGNDAHGLGAGDLADHGLDGSSDLLHHFRMAGLRSRLQRHVDFGDAALDFVHDRDDGGFGDF